MSNQSSGAPAASLHESHGPARDAWRWLRSHVLARKRLPIAALLIGVAVNFVILVVHTARVWFWADDWDLLFLRGNIPKYSVGLFAPHNNHWFTMHILVYRLVFELFGMRSYTPYAVTELCFHAAVVLVSYVLLRRVGAGAWVAVFGALVIAFFGLGTNAEAYAGSLNHVGALLFGLLAVVIATSKAFGRRNQLLASGALLLSIMFGLTGLAMFVLAGTFVLQRHGVLRAARVVVPPVLVFAVWWWVVGRHGSNNSLSTPLDLPTHLPKLPSYVWAGLTGTLGDGSGLTGAGPLLVAALVAGLLLTRREPDAVVQLAWAGLVADLFQLVLLGVGRFDFGPGQLGTSHYAYINLVLLMPAVILTGHQLIGSISGPRWRTALLTASLFAAYALNGITLVQKWQDDFVTLTGGGEDLALGIRAAVEDHQQVLSQHNPDPFNWLLIPRYVGSPQIRRALPQRAPSAQGLLEAQSYFFTGVSQRDYKLTKPAAITPYAGFGTKTLKPGCHPVQVTTPDPILQLQTGALGNEIVVWSNSTIIKTRLERGKMVGPTVNWTAKPGPTHIASSAPDATLYIAFNGSGTFTVCLA